MEHFADRLAEAVARCGNGVLVGLDPRWEQLPAVLRHEVDATDLAARLTDAAAPLPDSAVMAFSVIAQLLLMKRRLETWWFWLGVNTIAVPLFVSRGLYVTAALYAGFWLNAVISLRHWRRLLRGAHGLA